MVDLRFWKLCVGLEKLDTKSKTDDQQESINDQESLKVDESCKKGVTEDKAEEDVCPICLEGCVSLDHCKIYLIRLIGCFFFLNTQESCVSYIKESRRKLFPHDP